MAVLPINSKSVSLLAVNNKSSFPKLNPIAWSALTK